MATAIQILLALLKAFPVVAKLFTTVVDRYREYEANKRLVVKDLAVDNAIANVMQPSHDNTTQQQSKIDKSS